MTLGEPHFPRPGANGDPRGGAVWSPDLGDGRYQNPIIWADYSDPDVVRHGDDYFLVSSSFQCTPGLPILHSRDLVNWRIVNHAIKNLPHPRYESVQAGCGVWAPSIRFHDGRFWIFFASPDEGVYATSTTDPLGDWSKPQLVQAGKGIIDPCPFWDDDGQAYLVHAFAHSRCGVKHRLRLCPMAPDASRLLDQGMIVFRDEQRHPTIEGPKLYKRNGFYYILAPAGGVETGWQTALRARSLFGPYEDRVVLEQGATSINGPHQGGLVDTPSGEWWFIHFQDAGVYGRITHLQPVGWVDDWPLIGASPGSNGRCEPVLTHPKPVVAGAIDPRTPETTDEFSGATVGPQWQWNANHRDDWLSLSARPGWARLYCQPLPPGGLFQSANLLLQKYPAPQFAVETRLELPGVHHEAEAGIVLAGRQNAALGARRGSDGGLQLWLRRDGGVAPVADANAAAVRLRVEIRTGGRCRFFYAFDADNFSPVDTAFQAAPGVWVGARVGLYASGPVAEDKAHADFEYFRVSSLPAPAEHGPHDTALPQRRRRSDTSVL